MHLDLTHMLPEQVTADIGSTARKYAAYCPHMLWPLWLQHVDISKTPVNVLQAAAQRKDSFSGSMLALPTRNTSMTLVLTI